MTRLLVVMTVLLCGAPAMAHDGFTGKRDPVTGTSCCTTAANEGYGDCAVLAVAPGMLTGQPDGYRLRLTAEQARRINPLRSLPVDTVIPWNRVQPSWDGNYRLCIPSYPFPVSDFYCFWEPPNT
jgi:hypothetical protein